MFVSHWLSTWPTSQTGWKKLPEMLDSLIFICLTYFTPCVFFFLQHICCSVFRFIFVFLMLHWYWVCLFAQTTERSAGVSRLAPVGNCSDTPPKRFPMATNLHTQGCWHSRRCRAQWKQFEMKCFANAGNRQCYCRLKNITFDLFGERNLLPYWIPLKDAIVFGTGQLIQNKVFCKGITLIDIRSLLVLIPKNAEWSITIFDAISPIPIYINMF